MSSYNGISYLIKKKTFQGHPSSYIRKNSSFLRGIDEKVQEGQALLLSHVIIGIGGVIIIVVIVLLENGQLSLSLADHHVGKSMQGVYVALVELVLRGQAENEVALQPNLRLPTLYNRSNAAGRKITIVNSTF